MYEKYKSHEINLKQKYFLFLKFITQTLTLFE